VTTRRDAAEQQQRQPPQYRGSPDHRPLVHPCICPVSRCPTTVSAFKKPRAIPPLTQLLDVRRRLRPGDDPCDIRVLLGLDRRPFAPPALARFASLRLLLLPFIAREFLLALLEGVYAGFHLGAPMVVRPGKKNESRRADLPSDAIYC